MLHRSPLVRRIVLPVAVATAALVVASACSPAPMPISQSPRDPSSPLAPEGQSPLAAAVAKSAPVDVSGEGHEHRHHGASGPTHDDHSGHTHGSGHAGHVHSDHAASGQDGHGSDVGSGAADGGTQGTVYVCPMHPEVTSNAPGALCPKCNMKLVPKQ